MLLPSRTTTLAGAAGVPLGWLVVAALTTTGCDLICQHRVGQGTPQEAAPPGKPSPRGPAADRAGQGIGLLLTVDRLSLAGERLPFKPAPPAGPPPGWSIPPLLERLQARRPHPAAGPAAKTPDRTLHICAHPQVTFGVLKRVLYTCRQAGEDRLSLGAWRSGAGPDAGPCLAGGQRFPLLLPYPVRAARAQWPPEMRVPFEVHVGRDLLLRAGGERKALPRQGGRLDLPQLRRLLALLRGRLPHKRDLHVSAQDQALVGDLLAILRAATDQGFSELTLVDAGGVLDDPGLGPG